MILQGATLSMVEGGVEASPSRMARIDDPGYLWATRLPVSDGDTASIRIAVRAQRATWYAEVPTVFITTAE